MPAKECGPDGSTATQLAHRINTPKRVAIPRRLYPRQTESGMFSRLAPSSTVIGSITVDLEGPPRFSGPCATWTELREPT